MSDIYLTWASNINENNFPEYAVYFSSVCKHSNYGKKICLTDSLEEKYNSYFSSLGWEIVSSGAENILRDRHFAYWQYLCSCSPYDYVMISDSRDVLLQGNAIKEARFYQQNVILTSEGFPHRDSPFNMMDQLIAQQGVPERPFADWPVVNGGVILGLCGAVRNFCYMVWSAAIRARMTGTDQGIINYLYNHLREDKNYFLADPKCCNLCITGEGVKHKLIPFSPEWCDGKICLGEQPYFIFHQWERTEFREAVLQEYSVEHILPPCKI